MKLWGRKKKKGLQLAKDAEPENTDDTTSAPKGLRSEFPEDFEDELGRSRTARRRMEMQYAQNREFLRGNQYIRPGPSVNNSTGWVRIPKPIGRLREAVNMLVSPFRAITSRLEVDWPGMQCIPASTSRDDVMKAKASTLLLQYYWQQEKMKRHFRRGARLLAQYGMFSLHPYWDPDKTWVVTDCINPLDHFFEAGISRAEDSMWQALRDFTHRDELAETYPEYENEIKEMAPSTTWETSRWNSDDGKPKDRIETFEVYFKDGKHGLYAGKQWLHVTENKLPEIPIHIVRHTIIEDELWPMGALEPALPRQVIYNDMWNQCVQNVNLFANQKMMAAEGSINPRSLDPEKRIVWVDPTVAGGVEPHMMRIEPIPGHVFEMLRMSEEHIQMGTGIHNTTMGMRKPGDPVSGVGLETMSELDSGDLGTTKGEIEDAAEDHAADVLRLFKMYMNEEMAIRITDRSIGPVMHDIIKRTELVDEPEVHLHADAMFRDGAIKRRRESFQLFQAGIITPEEFKRRSGDWTANVDAIEDMMSEHHAQEILEVVANFHLIAMQTFGLSEEAFLDLPDDVLLTMLDVDMEPTDDPGSFMRVFSDYMRGAEFYQLPGPSKMMVQRVYFKAAAAKQQMAMVEQPVPGPQTAAQAPGMLPGQSTGMQPPSAAQGVGPQGSPNLPTMGPASAEGLNAG